MRLRLIKNYLRIFTGIILIAVLFLCGCTGKTAVTGGKGGQTEMPAIPDGKRLIVCTSHKVEVYEPIIREFEQRTGIWVDVLQGGTKAMLEKIREGCEFGDYDIMFGGGVETLDSYKYCFEPYVAGGSENLTEQLKAPDNSWTPFTELPIVFIYNTKLVSEEEAPAVWADLFDEKWKDRISFASPFESGTSYTIISALIQMAEKGGLNISAGEGNTDILKLFYDQLAGDLATGSGQVLDAVADGSKSIGITLEEAALRRIRDGEHIGIIYPADHIVAVPDGCAIVKNAPNFENAKLFVDFIISSDVQRFMSDEMLRRTVRTDIESNGHFQEIEIAGFDIVKSGEEEERILEQWREYELY